MGILFCFFPKRVESRGRQVGFEIPEPNGHTPYRYPFSGRVPVIWFSLEFLLIPVSFSIVSFVTSSEFPQLFFFSGILFCGNAVDFLNNALFPRFPVKSEFFRLLLSGIGFV